MRVPWNEFTYDPENFWAKVDKSGECWLWTGSLTTGARGGYGAFKVGGRKGKLLKAHRVSYTLASGPIPEGLQVDHLCRVRQCVNPGHMELVTNLENSRRGIAGARERIKTHCPSGHPYSANNTSLVKQSATNKHGPGAVWRRCLTCHREREERRREAKKQQ